MTVYPGGALKLRFNFVNSSGAAADPDTVLVEYQEAHDAASKGPIVVWRWSLSSPGVNISRTAQGSFVVSIPITRAGSLAVVGRGIGNDCDALNHYAEQIPAIPLPVPLP